MSRTVPIPCLSSLSLVAALAAQASLAAQAPPATVLQELPLGGLVMPFDVVPLFPGSFARVRGEDSSVGFAEDCFGTIGGDRLVALLRDEIGDEQLAQSSIDFNATRGSIFVRAPEDMTRKAAGLLGWLERIVARPLQIDVTVYAVDGEIADPRGSYGPGELRKLAGLRPLWSSSTPTAVHRPLGVENRAVRAVLLDYDVEVAQKADISDPRISELMTGLRAGVLPFAFSAGDDIGLVIDLAYAIRVDDGEQVSTGLEQQGTLDAPRLRSFVAAFSGRIKDGGSLVAWSLGDEKLGLRTAIEISARWRAPAAPAREDLAVLPVAFATGRLETRDDMGGDEDDGSGTAYGAGRGERLRSRRPDLQFDELAMMVQDAIGDLDRARLLISQLGPWLVVRGAPADVAAARAAVARLVDEAATQADLVFETKIGGSGEVLHALVAPGLTGMPVHLRRGEDGWRIHDFDVEIAQSSAVANPFVRRWFAGVSAAGLSSRRLGGLGASARVELVTRGATQRRGLETDFGGAFDATLFESATLGLDAAVERGATHTLGEGPSLVRGNGSVRTAQSVTVR